MPIQLLKWSSFYSDMESYIVGEFYPRNPLCPFLRHLTCKTPKVGLQTPINHFALSVGLRMVSRASLQLGVLAPKQFSPKIAEKDFISVRNNTPREPM